MFAFIDIVTAAGTHVTLVKPWLDTLNVKVMLASKKEDLVASHIGFQAYGAHATRVFFNHCLDGDRTKDLRFNSILLLNFLGHIVIIYLLESVDIHTVNWSLVVILIVDTLVVENSLPFIVPIYEVQVVFPSWVQLNRLILL
jgi:hypothetical protein